jgi:fumarate reductase subunit C
MAEHILNKQWDDPVLFASANWWKTMQFYIKYLCREITTAYKIKLSPLPFMENQLLCI